MDNHNRSYKWFIRNFYLYRFFRDFLFIYAVYVILFKMRGLSVFEISLLLALWCGFGVLLEVPTGALADKWNRKYMINLGMLSNAICIGIWFFADNFLLFALGFLFWGITGTFCSGTQEALLYDNLRKYKKEKEYEKVAGRGGFYSKIAVASSVFLGGFIAAYSFPLVIILSGLFALLAIIPTLFFHEVRFEKTSTGEVKYLDYIKNAFKESATNKHLLKLLLYSTVVLALIGTLEELQQLYFYWVNLPIAFFGVLAASVFGLQAIGSNFAYKFQKLFNNENNIYVLSIFAGIVLLVSVIFNAVVLLIPFVLVFFFGSTSEVLIEGRLQKQIKSDQRATILSINSLLLNLSALVFIVGFGILSKLGDLTWGFIVFGVIMILFSVFSIIFNNRK